MKAMTLTRTVRIGLLALLSLVPSPALAQQPPANYSLTQPAVEIELMELVLKDGSRAYGTIEREDDKEVVFRTQAGVMMTAPRPEIVSLRKVKGRMEKGEFMRADLHRTRLFFAPTGRSLKKGEVSFGVFQFIAPFVQVGVTDRISVGGGTPLIFGIDDFERPFWITPKVQVFDKGRTTASVGVLHVFAVGEQAGIAYGVGTYGNTDNAVTIGGGYGYNEDARTGIIMVGAEGRVHRNLKVMTENYMWKNGDGILSGGVRFLGERLSADLALAIPLGIGDLFIFPVVNFVYVF